MVVLKKKMLSAAAAAFSLALLLVPVSSHAGNEECINLAKLSYAFAEVRDSGARMEDVLAKITSSYKAGNMSRNDYDMSVFFLKFVYTGGQDLSPAEVRRQIVLMCNKYQPK